MNDIQVDLNMVMVVFTIIQIIMVCGFIGGIIYLNMKLNKLIKIKNQSKLVDDQSVNKEQND